MKKGFTLIELLAVMAILGILATITTPIVVKVIAESKDKAYDEQVNLVEAAAERWGVSNLKKLPTTSGDYCCISLTTLCNEGYLTNEEVNDPRQKAPMAGDIKITYNDSYKQYIYNYEEEVDTSCKVCQ